MASSVSSIVGGWWIGRSWAAGYGRSDRVWTLSLLRRELKYSCHSTRRSLSLLGGMPSLILTLTLGSDLSQRDHGLFSRWWCSPILNQLVWALPFVCWALPFHQLYKSFLSDLNPSTDLIILESWYDIWSLTSSSSRSPSFKVTMTFSWRHSHEKLNLRIFTEKRLIFQTFLG